MKSYVFKVAIEADKFEDGREASHWHITGYDRRRRLAR
jgi:hypothetical protein